MAMSRIHAMHVHLNEIVHEVQRLTITLQQLRNFVHNICAVSGQ